jgi:hypothetical protein
VAVSDGAITKINEVVMSTAYKNVLRISLYTLLSVSTSLSLAGLGGIIDDKREEVAPQSEPPCEVDVSPYSHSPNDGHEHYHHKEAVGAHYHGDVWHDEYHTHGGDMHGGSHEDGQELDGCNQTGNMRVMFEDMGPLETVDLVDAAIGITPAVIVRGEAYPWADYQPVEELIWRSDEELARSGLPGSGTLEDPYIIENRFVTKRLEIRNTDACVVVRNNIATGTHLKGPLVNPEEIVDLGMLHFQLDEISQDKHNIYMANRSQRRADYESYKATLPEYNDYLKAHRQGVVEINNARGDVSATMRQINNQNTVINNAKSSAVQAHASIKSKNNNMPPLPANLGDFTLQAEEGDTNDYSTEMNQIKQAGTDIEQALVEISVLQDRLMQQRNDYSLAREQIGVIKTEHMGAIQARNDALASFRADNSEYRKSYNEYKAAYNDVKVVTVKRQEGELEYAGNIFETKDQIVQWALNKAGVQKEEDALIVLDWNGTCVHAYHNVSDDMRVNQNNPRTGYATGGIIENNRLHDVSQLRHYDGIFRENEVGNKDILNHFLNGDVWIGDRAINVDGFNQGMLTKNTFYGRVDLDFHGHHHGAGFFAPHSHYHGDDKSRMMGPDGKMKHDHTRRWTSVLFSENTVIDPAGAGIRYEDRNHDGDDRQANSENVGQLNAPHIHRSLIEIKDNFVVGSVFVDVFNADGVDIWSDNLMPVKVDLAGQITDAIDHMDAHVISTHQARNDGWVSISGNRIIDPSGGLSAITIQAVKEAEVDISYNEAASIGIGAKPTISEFQDIQDIQDVDLATLSWGGFDNNHDSAILIRGVKDTLTSICSNRAYGFDHGVTATQDISKDSPIDVCNDNEMGDINIVYKTSAGELSIPNFIETEVDDMFGDANAIYLGGDVEPLEDVPYQHAH